MDHSKERKALKLYLIYQEEVHGYDTYDSAVVCASSEEEAKLIHPGGGSLSRDSCYLSWTSNPENVSVTFLGLASPSVKEGVIVASFNAG